MTVLGADHDLTFDLVASHISSSSPWFTGWLEGGPRCDGHFFEPRPDSDISPAVRPRTSPLVPRYRRPDSRDVSAWTTFGRD